MVYPEYAALARAREAAALRIEKEVSAAPDPVSAMKKANAELDSLGAKIAECEKRLFSSNEFDDKVYRLRFLRGRRIENIAMILHVDASTIYRSLRRMKKVAKK